MKFRGRYTYPTLETLYIDNDNIIKITENLNHKNIAKFKLISNKKEFFKLYFVNDDYNFFFQICCI